MSDSSFPDIPQPICNINGNERSKRLMAGFLVMMLSAVLIGLIRQFGLSNWWRILLIGPYYLAGLGFVQGFESTCVRLAAMEMRKFDGKLEKIDNPAEIKALKQKASLIKIKSLIVAIIFTAISLFL
jgi:hypothetical protein